MTPFPWRALIVSDFAVNREIDDPSVEFFPAGHAGALAEKMEKRLHSPRTHGFVGQTCCIGPPPPRRMRRRFVERGRARN